MYGYIYMTINILNGKRYIGKRQGNFDNWYKGSGTLLKKAINRYGYDNFTVELLDDSPNNKDELNNREKYWIEHYNAVDDPMFYNIARGGDGGHLIAGYDEETKRLINNKKKVPLCNNIFHKIPRIGNLNHFYGKRGKDSIHYGNKYNLGRKASEETKQKMRESHNPDNIPPNHEGKLFINNGNTNKLIYSEELDKYISEGWSRGRISYSNKRYYVNNGSINKRVSLEEINEYIDNGWKRGRLNKRSNLNLYNELILESDGGNYNE